MPRDWFSPHALILAACLGITGLGGCAPAGPSDGNVPTPVYRNTTDPTNQEAAYLGSSACSACHTDIATKHRLHGHAWQLNRSQGQPPAYPAVSGVPQPPAGFDWMDVSYVVGGYLRKANFVDQDGFLITTGEAGVEAQWNLSYPPAGTVAGFAPFEPSAGRPLSYEYTCFSCHTTGPTVFDPAAPTYQENRPGIRGTWHEAGVQCEACHGPGSRHPGSPGNRDLFVDGSAAFCGRCHSSSADGVIHSAGGFIGYREQYAELRASGGHANFDCIACHDPHASAHFDPVGIARTCTSCHPNRNLGIHTGKTHVRGDYVEALSCVSCHMPLAGRSAGSSVVGQSAGRIGDVRTHIFRIDTRPLDFTNMFTPDGGAVLKDGSGRAATTLDFVCLRCHNTENGYPFRLTLRSAGEIATGIHRFD